MKKTAEKPFLQVLLETGQIPKQRTASPLAPRAIEEGGMSSVCSGEVKYADIWFKRYGQTYLEQDARRLSQVGNIIAFRNVLRLACLRTGSILRVSELARDAKLNVATTSPSPTVKSLDSLRIIHNYDTKKGAQRYLDCSRFIATPLTLLRIAYCRVPKCIEALAKGDHGMSLKTIIKQTIAATLRSTIRTNTAS